MLVRVSLCVLESMGRLIRKDLGICLMVYEVICIFGIFIGGGEKSMVCCFKERCLMFWFFRMWFGGFINFYKVYLRR